MAIGKGGSSGSQNQATSGTYGGNTSNASIAMPIAPGGYQDAWSKLIQGGGQTPGQTAAGNFFTGNGQEKNNLLDPNANQWYGSLDRAAAISPYATAGGYTSMTPTPQSADPNQVIANQGAAYMNAYQNPYTQQVVDATTADMNQGLNTGLNSLKASYGGQYGNGRQDVAAGQAVGDYTRALGTTIGGLRSQGFNTALAGGQADASNALTASGQNVSNLMGNNQFNAGLQNNANQFGANTTLQANRDIMNNSATAAGIGTNAANSAANIGGNQYTQFLQALGAGTPLFGSFNAGANDAAGQQQGTSQGSNSSKGGGASVG